MPELLLLLVLFVVAHSPFSNIFRFLEWLLFNSQIVAGRCSLLPYDMALVFAIMYGDFFFKSAFLMY